MLFGRFVDFQNAQHIHLGDNVVVSNFCRLSAGADIHQSITIQRDVFIGIGTVLCADSGSVVVQRGTNIGSECRILAKNTVVIGRDVLIAAYCIIGEPLNDADELRDNVSTMIADDVWLGARSQVCAMVQIGKGAIVGAHAVVDRNVNSYGIAVGRPARTVRYRK